MFRFVVMPSVHVSRYDYLYFLMFRGLTLVYMVRLQSRFRVCFRCLCVFVFCCIVSCIVFVCFMFLYCVRALHLPFFLCFVFVYQLLCVYQ